MLISIIVATYNQPECLTIILDSFICQTDKKFEVIVADDGSTQKTEDLIAHYKRTFPYRLVHIRQEDRGYRLAAVKNLGAMQARGEYFIFLDGDCVSLPGFVFRHRRLAQPGWFVRGSRIKLTDSFTATVKLERLPIFNYSIAQWIRLRMAGKVQRILPLLHLPGGFFRKLKYKKWQGATGFNLAFYRKDFYAVGGFDERFEGRGYEDSDLVVRMLNRGVRRKDGNYAVTVLHLGDDKIELPSKNYQMFQQAIRQQRVYAQRGISRC